MIRTFRHRGLKRLWEDAPSRISAALRDRLEHCLHPLKGELKGLWSVTISGNWRLTFRFEDGHAFDVDLTDYH